MATWKCALPCQVMDTPSDPTYSTLEVDQSSSLPQIRSNDQPEPVHDECLPEATPSRKMIPREPATEPPQTSIWGLRKRHIWILFGIVIIIIVATAIGTGVGLTIRNRRNNPNDERVDAVRRNWISSESYIAAANYTDKDGAEHSQVYFQDESQAIQMADFNIETKIWSIFPVQAVNNGSMIEAKSGTPISAFNYYAGNDSNSADFNVRFIDSNNTVRVFLGIDRAVDNWVIRDADALFVASENSAMTSYAKGCPDCPDIGLLVYEAPGGFKAVQTLPFNFEVSGFQSGVEPADKSPFTIAPIFKFPRLEGISKCVNISCLAIYCQSKEGSLEEVYVDQDLLFVTTHTSLPTSIDDGSSLAAMSQNVANVFLVQVLNTKSSGGVRLTYYNGTENSWKIKMDISSMEEVRAFSPIAATQAGRVYAIVDGKDGPELTEWIRVEGSLTEFEKVGIVVTNSS